MSKDYHIETFSLDDISQDEDEAKRAVDGHWVKCILITFIVSMLFTKIESIVGLISDNLFIAIGPYVMIAQFAYVSIALISQFTPGNMTKCYIKSENKSYSGKWWLKLIYFIVTFSAYYLCWARRMNAGYLHALWQAPLSLVIVYIVLWVKSYKPPIGSGSKSTPDLSVSDLESIRRAQDLAGVNPDSMPITGIGPNAKDMSISDWESLARTMDLAGYKDVYKR